MSALTALKESVLAALAAELGDRAKTLETYQGDWRAGLRREGRRLPAVLLMFRESRAEQVGPSSYDLTQEFTVLVVLRKLRGGASGPGEEQEAWELLAGIRRALWHQDLGLNLLPLALVKEEPLLQTREFAVYGARYRTGEVQDF